MFGRGRRAILGQSSGHTVRGAAIVLSFDGDKLPTEFRLFKSGLNETRKGTFLFDEAAAASVMAAYHEHGVDLAIDLEHLSIAAEEVSGDARNFDPDARGYCKLAVRNGELWAVQVTWNPDGEARLRERRQRYVSPAFHHDGSGRITSVHNIAITAMPATDHTPALVATDRSPTQGPKPMDPKTLIKLAGLVRGGMSHEDAMSLLAIDIKTLQSVVKAIGGDPSGDLTAMFATVQGFAKELAAAAAGEEPPPESNGGEGAEPPAEAAMMRQVLALSGNADPNAALETLASWKRAAVEHEANVAKLAADRKVLEDGERRGLVAQLVKLGRETPGTAWADDGATKPRGILATMPLDELRERVKAFGGSPVTGNATPPTRDQRIRPGDGVEISEFELARVKHSLSVAKRLDGTQVTEDEAIARFEQIKRQQIAGAASKGNTTLARMVSRPLNAGDVICSANGRASHANLVALVTPVKPIEEFGATSQRAMEEFRLEYMAKLASQPTTWAEELGSVVPGGLKDTYPIDFAVSIYKKKVAQNAPARTANVKEITITKDLYHEAEECELYRLQQGDFAYVKSWVDKAARMARARVFLRNQLVATLLEDNGNWVDGVAFFATTHKVDPFDAARTFRASATWSNLQDGTAAPLGASVLTAEKNLFLYSTPGPDGQELGHEADGLLFPTYLNETAKNLITVQDLIREDNGTDDVQVRNPHFGSGMGLVRAPELTGTATTADWYLVSRAGFAAGLVPWIISEDPSEEIIQWDESSDFYKESGFIKYESKIRVAAGLLYPHAIRKVQGT